MRERITISIQKELLGKLDHQVDGSKIRNRSHAIEHFLTKSLDNNDISNAVILAGGQQAIKLIPSIEQSIKLLSDYGVTTIYLAVGFLGSKIKEYFGDGLKYNLNLIYLEGGEGTAGAIKPLEKLFTKSFFVFNSNEKITTDLERLASFHRMHLSSFTLAVNDLEDPTGVYLFEPEIFTLIPKGFSMLETDVFPKLLSENKILTLPIIK